MIDDLLEPQHRSRVDAWRLARDFVAIGNLGEHVTARVLVDLSYQILATQDDLVGGVANILDRPATENPEDFIVIDPAGRLITVNSKASVSTRTCRLTSDGDLIPPSLRGQGDVAYYSMRAGLISPLDHAETHGQVVKVDLIHAKAQVFEIGDDGKLTRCSPPIDVAEIVETILDEHTGRVPPPRSENLD